MKQTVWNAGVKNIRVFVVQQAVKHVTAVKYRM